MTTVLFFLSPSASESTNNWNNRKGGRNLLPSAVSTLQDKEKIKRTQEKEIGKNWTHTLIFGVLFLTESIPPFIRTAKTSLTYRRPRRSWLEYSRALISLSEPIYTVSTDHYHIILLVQFIVTTFKSVNGSP